MLKRHMCLLTLSRHCAVREKLTTILIEKMPLRLIIRWCGQYKMQTTQKCRLGTKYRMQTAD